MTEETCHRSANPKPGWRSMARQWFFLS